MGRKADRPEHISLWQAPPLESHPMGYSCAPCYGRLLSELVLLPDLVLEGVVEDLGFRLVGSFSTSSNATSATREIDVPYVSDEIKGHGECWFRYATKPASWKTQHFPGFDAPGILPALARSSKVCSWSPTNAAAARSLNVLTAAHPGRPR